MGEAQKSIFKRFEKIRLHIAGELGKEFYQILKTKNNSSSNRDLHYMLAALAASQNEFYKDFSNRKVGAINPEPNFDKTNKYEHSGIASNNTDSQTIIILTIAFQYYSKYKKSISSFEELYKMEDAEILNPLNMAASRGLEMLIDDGFDIENDDILRAIEDCQ